MVRQGCIARGINREGRREEGRRICCSYTVVLFHAPFRAENYSGARDSLWKCILNGSERTANDTRDCTFRPAPPSTIYISHLLDSVSPFLIILLLLSGTTCFLNAISFCAMQLSLSLYHLYNTYMYKCTEETIKKKIILVYKIVPR